jgi:RimJ/RimL family protein N-acetyltransferase
MSVTLRTHRLLLRPYKFEDIPALLPLIGSREVAATTLRIPHPYTQADAEEFVRRAQANEDDSVRFAVEIAASATLIGGVGLRMNAPHHHAELGYWLGVPYWGQGYATEAARELVRYGFEDLKLHRIYASYVPHNPASGKILRKIGMKEEGYQRGHILKWGEYLDLVMYGMLASDLKK